MMTIFCDTDIRGTLDHPVYFIFLYSGMLLVDECWLRGETEAEALADARKKFPGKEFRFSFKKPTPSA